MDIYAVFKIDLHAFSLLICLAMLIGDLALPGKRLLPNRIFRGLIIFTMITLAVDLIGVYSDGKPELIGLSYVVEVMLYVLAPIVPSIWATYVSCQLYQDVQRLRIELRVMTAPVLINAALVFLSPFYGLMFTISNQNVFSRGPFYFVLCAVSLAPILYSTIMLLAFVKREPLKVLAPLLVFPLPIVAAALFQIIFYGASVIWPGVTLAIFIIYISLQTRQYTIDHLTGAFNRRQLDSHLAVRIRGARRGKPFSCIMLDIDNFKTINDEFGHIVGDEALFDAAQLLRSCIRGGDFLSRFAGDEFVILLDVADQEVLEATVSRIRACAHAYNQTTQKPFRLDFSVGYEVYGAGSDISLERFIARVDSLMYGDKSSKKESPPV